MEDSSHWAAVSPERVCNTTENSTDLALLPGASSDVTQRVSRELPLLPGNGWVLFFFLPRTQDAVSSCYGTVYIVTLACKLISLAFSIHDRSTESGRTQNVCILLVQESYILEASCYLPVYYRISQLPIARVGFR